MTVHVKEAQKILEHTLSYDVTDDNTTALVNIGAAQIQATLALVEQQRIANLIALLPGIEIPETGGAIAQGDGLTEVIRKTNHKGREYGIHQLRPEIKEALGL